MLVLTESTLKIIQHEVIQSYPNECCGFLLGNEANGTCSIVAVLVCENKSTTKRNSFLITASDYMKAEQSAEENGLTLLGVYHSHPDCEARPSGSDLASAISNFSYLIVSVSGDIITDIRSWRLNEAFLFDEEKINIHLQINSKKEIAYGNRNYSYTLA